MYIPYPPKIWCRSVPQLGKLDRTKLPPPSEKKGSVSTKVSDFHTEKHIEKLKQVYNGVYHATGLHPPRIW